MHPSATPAITTSSKTKSMQMPSSTHRWSTTSMGAPLSAEQNTKVPIRILSQIYRSDIVTKLIYIGEENIEFS